MITVEGLLLIVALFVLLFFIGSIARILREYERAVIFRLGRSTKAILNPGGQGNGPGLVLLVPLIDGDVTLAERIRAAKHVLHTDLVSKEQAVEALVKSDDPWLRACGAFAIGSLGLENLSQELQKCLEHPDPLLRETALQAQVRLTARS